MKLISCHIENYGSISQKDIDFKDGITAFCEGNGYGKSTIASFLKAMFYGLDPVRANAKEFVERKHFYPFNGGAFGGSVKFVSGGNEYKIERYFDEKSEIKDTVTVYKNGVCDHTLEENIGERLFDIDRQSFERTVFITSEDIDIASTGSINAKLNYLVAGSNDSINLESALTLLEKKSKIYKKSRQGNDLITEASQKLTSLTANIENCKKIEATLPEKKRRVKEFNDRIAALNDEITAAQTNNLTLNDWDTYDGFLKEAETASLEVERLKKAYPMGLPQKSELDCVRETLKQDEILSAQLESKTFSSQDEEKYKRLKEQFTDGVPTEERLSRVKEDIYKSAALDAEIATLIGGELSEDDLKLKQRFLYHCPSDDEIESLTRDAEKYKALEADCSSLSEFTASPTEQGTKYEPRKKVFIALAALFSAVALVGAGLMFVSILAGAIMLAAGAAALLGEGFIYLNKKSSQTAMGTTQTENPEKRKKVEELKALREKIGAVTAVYGYTLENGAVYAVKCLKDDFKRFKTLSDDQSAKSASLKIKQDEKNLLISSLDQFFLKYGKQGENYIDLLSTLNSETSEYLSLSKRRELSLSGEQEVIKKLEDNRASLVPFIKKYGVEFSRMTDTLTQMENDLSQYTAAEKAAEERRKKAESFAKEKNLTVRPDAVITDLRELNEKLTRLIDERNTLLIEITVCEDSADRLGELLDEYNETKEKLDEYKKIYEILNKTADKLVAADRKLKDKYIKPVRDRFVNYSSLLEKTLGEKLIFNTNFEIRYERSGKERSDKHLSAGQKSICALCFRLALIDNMYDKEKPFIILDDPFVHLDAEHFSKVKEMISELSKNMQLIYFTCHDSRNI